MHFYITWEISEQFSCREFSLFSYIILENTRISASEIYNLQLNFGLYLAVNWKNNTDVTIFRRDVIVKLFWRCFVSLVKFSYWSKFHINIITGSGVMTIFFYKGVTRHSEIRNTPVWVFPNSEDWGELRILTLEPMSLIKCYWMLQNARVTAFTAVSELLRENQQGRNYHPHPLPHPD